MRQPPALARHNSPSNIATPSKLSRDALKRRQVWPLSFNSASSVMEPRDPVPAFAHGTACPPSCSMSAEDTALPIVVWSEFRSESAGAAEADVLLVRIERSTSAFSRLKPPAPQAASGRLTTTIAAFALAEAITLHCLLSKACAIRDNRQPPLIRDNLRKTMSDTELTSGDFTEAGEPFRLFAAWL